MDIFWSSLGAEIAEEDRLRVAVAQMAPIWMDRAATLAKIQAVVRRAATCGCRLVVFGEALTPGYPFWIERTDGARFDSPEQKRIFAAYADQAVVVERGDLEDLQAIAAENRLAIYLGVVERPGDRGGHSLYCSLVYIDEAGLIASVHRKLQPTYEERLVWSPGDGAGLVTHALHPFCVGGLNCFENWMPLSRAALYAQGENLHVAVWPGGERNTADITRFIAQEARSYVISASGIIRREDFAPTAIGAAGILADKAPLLANGGSAIAGPDGKWVVAPIVDQEVLIVADLDHRRVREERQNFDLAGHYSRPDITRLVVNWRRQAIGEFLD